MKGVLRCHVVLLLLVMLTGCASLVKVPHVTVRTANIVSVDTAGFDLEVLIGVENQNFFDVSLQSYTYDLQVMSVPFTSGGQQKGFLFPSGKSVDIRLPFRIYHSDLIGIIKRRPDLDRIPYSLDARLNLDTPLGELTIPVKKNDTVSVPKEYRPESYLKRMLQPLKEMF
ncbi:MAG: LEA type 2 family protein [Desulfuromonadaceae bacterium]|nr:LEA type 2 family protein [Desulfuromonadaceae bacterium]